jgi:hypothetical protein
MGGLQAESIRASSNIAPVLKQTHCKVVSKLNPSVRKVHRLILSRGFPCSKCCITHYALVGTRVSPPLRYTFSAAKR